MSLRLPCQQNDLTLIPLGKHKVDAPRHLRVDCQTFLVLDQNILGHDSQHVFAGRQQSSGRIPASSAKLQ
jgi:hypothetical protein